MIRQSRTRRWQRRIAYNCWRPWLAPSGKRCCDETKGRFLVRINRLARPVTELQVAVAHRVGLCDLPNQTLGVSLRRNDFGENERASSGRRCAFQILRPVPGAEIPEQNDAARQKPGIVAGVHAVDNVRRRLAVVPGNLQQAFERRGVAGIDPLEVVVLDVEGVDAGPASSMGSFLLLSFGSFCENSGARFATCIPVSAADSTKKAIMSCLEFGSAV